MTFHLWAVWPCRANSWWERVHERARPTQAARRPPLFVIRSSNTSTCTASLMAVYFPSLEIDCCATHAVHLLFLLLWSIYFYLYQIPYTTWTEKVKPVTMQKHILMFPLARFVFKIDASESWFFSLASQFYKLGRKKKKKKSPSVASHRHVQGVGKMHDPKSNISARYFTDAWQTQSVLFCAPFTLFAPNKYSTLWIIPQRTTLPVPGKQRTALSISERVAGTNL